jgi:pimeloyl-ACP methyl ester carboxylesterase
MQSIRYLSDGPVDAEIMVLIHGWPDTPDLWTVQIKDFQQDYRCIRIALPNYDDHLQKKRLYSFEEIVDSVIECVERLLRDSRKDRVILVGHDWGAYLSYLIEAKRPDLVSRLITMDVGAVLKPESFSHALAIVSYQWALIVSFCVGVVIAPLGNFLTILVSRVLGVPKTARPKWQMNYLYLHFWQLLLARRLPRTHRLPSCPFLYLYGEKKPFMFHSKSWLEKILSQRGNGVVGFAESGHWIMLDEAQRTNQEIRQFLQA